MSMYGKNHYNIVREICMQVKKQQLELDMEQQTGKVPNRERSTSRLYIVTLLI